MRIANSFLNSSHELINYYMHKRTLDTFKNFIPAEVKLHFFDAALALLGLRIVVLAALIVAVVKELGAEWEGMKTIRSYKALSVKLT